MVKAMHLAYIANNYGSVKDGIGDYAALIAKKISAEYPEIKIDLLTAYTVDKSNVGKIGSFAMSKILLEARKKIRENSIDAILIEYPFVEYNPIIVLAYYLMSCEARQKSMPVFLSLHEYQRVNALRQKTIRALVRMSDYVFITDPDIPTLINEDSAKFCLRSIPSSIVFDGIDLKQRRGKYSFVFFGLVNGAKAFSELMEAWEKFDNEKKCLTIITSSDLSDCSFIPNSASIVVKRNLPSCDVAIELASASFAIFPIKPQVEMNNSSFMAGCQAGCVPIGHFSEMIRDKNFVIETNGLSVDDLREGFDKAIRLGEDDREQLSSKAQEFGSHHTVDNTAKEIATFILERHNVIKRCKG